MAFTFGTKTTTLSIATGTGTLDELFVDCADDTWSGTTTQAPALLGFDIHYQKNTMGSRQEYIK